MAVSSSSAAESYSPQKEMTRLLRKKSQNRAMLSALRTACAKDAPALPSRLRRPTKAVDESPVESTRLVDPFRQARKSISAYM